MAERHPAVERGALVHDTKLDGMVGLLVDHKVQIDRIYSLAGRPQAHDAELRTSAQNIDDEGHVGGFLGETQHNLRRPTSERQANVRSINQRANPSGDVDRLYRRQMTIRKEKLADPGDATQWVSQEMLQIRSNGSVNNRRVTLGESIGACVRSRRLDIGAVTDGHDVVDDLCDIDGIKSQTEMTRYSVCRCRRLLPVHTGIQDQRTRPTDIGHDGRAAG